MRRAHRANERVEAAEGSGSGAASSAAELSRRQALKAGAAGLAVVFSLSHMTPAIADELERLAQGPLMTGEHLAGILRTERARWDALLARVGVDRLDVPGVEGEWSVKEIVAHLSWYEGRVVEGALQVLGTGTLVRPKQGLAALPIDEKNARIAEAARARPAGEVLAEAEQTFEQLLALIRQAPTDILNDPYRLGLPDDMMPWMGVANNSYAHYREHEAAIEAWLARQG